MDGRDSSVPVRFVSDKVVPEFVGGEFRGDYYAAARGERGEESGEEAVDVEEGHYEHGAVAGRKIVSLADVL